MSDQRPYDPRAEALDALAAMRWPDVSEPPAEQVAAVEALLRAEYEISRLYLWGQWLVDARIAAWIAASNARLRSAWQGPQS